MYNSPRTAKNRMRNINTNKCQRNTSVLGDISKRSSYTVHLSSSRLLHFQKHFHFQKPE